MGNTDTPPPPPPVRRSRLHRVLRGPDTEPVWARPGFLLVVVSAAVLYTWALDASGYGNEYYAAAAYSGSLDWTAWLFGSVDTASFISVDKPPLSLWVTGLSVRAFGLSSWSVLLPHALAGVATVVVLHHSVRRWHGPAAALGAAVALAVTPIAVVMFRYNNPDAILTLLMVGSLAIAYSATRHGSWWRIAAAGALVGLAFLTKTSQALLVIPAIGVTYLVAAPVSLSRRIVHLAGSGVAAVSTAGWWVALAEWSPAAPFFGGSETGSFLEYALGYNGLGRVTGQGVNPGDPFGGGGGWGRLFNGEVGGQVSWLIPMAVVGFAAGFLLRRGRPRTDPVRAGWVLWGTAFLAQVAAFSLMDGVFHPYYTLTIAPAIAALAGAGVVAVWREARSSVAWSLGLGSAIVATAGWAAVLLARTPDFAPGLGIVLVIAALTAAGLLVAGPSVRASPAMAVAALALGLAAALGGPASYALDAIGTDYSGGDPKAGPGETGLSVAAPGDGPAAAPADQDGDAPRALPADRPPGEAPGQLAPPPGGDRPVEIDGPPARDSGPRGGVRSSSALTDYLLAERDDETWLVAVQSAQTAADLILATGEPVMAVGGFGGRDPAPTPVELAEYLESGELRFVLLTGDRGVPAWGDVVAERCSVVDAAEHGGGPATLYDCAA